MTTTTNKIKAAAKEIAAYDIVFDAVAAEQAFVNGASIRSVVDDALWDAGIRWADGGNEAAATRNLHDA